MLEYRFGTTDFLRQKLSVPLDASGIVGYHGTSIAALRILLETGKFPGCPCDRKQRLTSPEGISYGLRGDLHFMPRPSLLPETLSGFRVRAKGLTDSIALDVAKSYARLNAEQAIAAEQIGRSLDDCEVCSFLLELSPYTQKNWELLNQYLPRVIDGAADFGMDRETLYRTFFSIRRMAKLHKGVLIGIDASICADYLLGTGDEQWDLFTNVNDGLPQKYIAAIHPLGRGEKMALSSLIRGRNSSLPHPLQEYAFAL